MQAPAGQICLLAGFFSVHFLRSLRKRRTTGRSAPFSPISHLGCAACRGGHCPPVAVGSHRKVPGRIWNPPLRRRGRRPRRPGNAAAAAKFRRAGKARPYPFFPCNRFAIGFSTPVLLYTSDAADDLLCVDLGGRRIIKKKKKKKKKHKKKKKKNNKKKKKKIIKE